MSEIPDPFAEIVAGLELGECNKSEYETVPFAEFEKLQDALVDHLVVVGAVEGTGDETVPLMELLEDLMQDDFNAMKALRVGDNVRLSDKGFVIFLDNKGNEALGQFTPKMYIEGTVERFVVSFAPVDQANLVYAEGSAHIPDQVSVAIEVANAKKVFSTKSGDVHAEQFGSQEESFVYVPLIYSKMKIQRQIRNAPQITG